MKKLKIAAAYPALTFEGCVQTPNQVLLPAVTTFQCAGPAVTRLITVKNE